jgi:hypothetical protein
MKVASTPSTRSKFLSLTTPLQSHNYSHQPLATPSSFNPYLPKTPAVGGAATHRITIAADMNKDKNNKIDKLADKVQVEFKTDEGAVLDLNEPQAIVRYIVYYIH